MCKGCKLYTILALNEKYDAERLEDFPVVSKFVDFFPGELLDLPPNREFPFTIDINPVIGPISRMPYRMSTLEL